MMKDNLYYFETATNYKEKLIDENYHKIVDRQVIPSSKQEKNELTESNEKLIRYIDTIQTMITDLGYLIDSDEVKNVILLIIEELKTKGMNYSAFSQYFNVHNMNYSIFNSLKLEEKVDVIKFIIVHYISDRHKMYKSHGYSNIVLQVMSDNYSHKRKGSYGVSKIADTLMANGLDDLVKMKDKSFEQESYYLLADKTGKNLFRKFAEKYNLKLSGEGRETKKYPDALIKIGKDILIVEQKNMKENGGGQDKQTGEITDFIDKVPEFDGLHYITFVDGIYFNQLDKNAKAKTLNHYKDIVSVLGKFKENYFVNSYSFNLLINDCLNNNKTLNY